MAETPTAANRIQSAASKFVFGVPILICLGCGQLPEVPPPNSHRTFATPRVSDITAAPIVDFCQLVEHSVSYNRKLVRVTGRYRTGEEESTLFSPACPSTPFTLFNRQVSSRDKDVFFWLDFTVKRFSGQKALERLHATPYRYTEMDVNVVGQFEDGLVEERRYGHLGGYAMQLIVFKVDD
jgi:hypothetical protein